MTDLIRIGDYVINLNSIAYADCSDFEKDGVVWIYFVAAGTYTPAHAEREKDDPENKPELYSWYFSGAEGVALHRFFTGSGKFPDLITAQDRDDE